MDDLIAFVAARLNDDGRPVVTERMRREIAAKRAILALLEQDVKTDGRERDYDATEALGQVVRILAAIWSDHAGYRPEWKP